jgi:hypothetical protein
MRERKKEINNKYRIRKGGKKGRKKDRIKCRR